MKSFLIPIFATLFITPVCLAEGIFKCTAGTGVTYQSAPCTEGTLQVVLATPTTKLDASVNDGISAATLAAPAPAKQSGISLIEAGLQPGISDLQVLNDRHWGRPQRITRTARLAPGMNTGITNAVLLVARACILSTQSW